MLRSNHDEIRLPSTAARWLDRRVEAGDFASRSEALEHLVRQARATESRAVLASRIRAGLRSGKPTPLTLGLLRDIERRGDARLREAARLAPNRRKKSA